MLGNAQSVDSPISFAPVPVDELDSDSDDDGHDTALDELTSRQAYCLYVSHSLSMWNSRMYEFSVVRLLPPKYWRRVIRILDSLHPSCIPRKPQSFVHKVSRFSLMYCGPCLTLNRSGIAETVCVLFFSGALDRWIDRNPSRLQALLLTITTNRITVLVSCTTWFLILTISNSAQKHIFFAIALFLGMVEKLSRGTNILCMERDWVPTLANPCVDASSPTPYDLTYLNTVMRRIDMLCKLIAPLAVSTFISTVGSERIAVAVVAGISTLSWGLECGCVQQVWKQNGRLRAQKDAAHDTRKGGNANDPMQLSLHGYMKVSSAHHARDLVLKIVSEVLGSIRAYVT